MVRKGIEVNSCLTENDYPEWAPFETKEKKVDLVIMIEVQALWQRNNSKRSNKDMLTMVMKLSKQQIILLLSMVRDQKALMT